MNSEKRTYKEMLMNYSTSLNPGLDPHLLLRKEGRVQLSDRAKKNLRAAIAGKPTIVQPQQLPTVLPTECEMGYLEEPIVKEPVKPRGVSKKERVKSVTHVSKPVILATASDWVGPGSVLGASIYDSGVFGY